MQRTQIAVLLVVVSMVAPAPAVAQVKGSPELTASVGDGRVIPGEDTTLTVTLANRGDVTEGSDLSLTSEVTTAQGVKVDLRSRGAPVSVRTGTQTTGTLAKGQSQPFDFDISVDEDAEPGTYDMAVVVEYKYVSEINTANQNTLERTTTERFNVDVTVEDRARFEVVDTETDVRIDSSGTVDVTMENIGTEAASNTEVALSSSNSDLTFGNGANSATRFKGTWEPGEQKTVEYQVAASSSAKEQSYAFTATARFEDTDGTSHESEPLTLGVTPLREQRFNVLETESRVAVGDTGTVTLTMQNDGAIDVSDATVTLESRSSDIVFGNASSASRFVGSWAAGGNKTVEFDATARSNADTRSYALDASVTFEDQNGDSGQSRSVSLGVTPRPEMAFSLDNISSDLKVGEERTIRGTITNDGETVARDVVVQFTTDNSNVNPTDTEYSVGTLQPGESAEFDFSVEISDSAAAGPRQFAFVAEYRNSEDETRRSDSLLTRQDVGPKTDTFDVDVSKGKVANGNTGEIQVAVTNTENETLSDISAKLFADDPISAEDSEGFISELKPGETETINFTVSASGAINKDYPISMDFQYTDGDGDTLVSDTYRTAVTVTTSEGGGGGLSLILVGLGVAAIVGIGGYIRFR